MLKSVIYIFTFCFVVFLILLLVRADISEKRVIPVNYEVMRSVQPDCEIKGSRMIDRKRPSRSNFICYDKEEVHSKNMTTNCSSKKNGSSRCNGDQEFCSTRKCDKSSGFYCKGEEIISLSQLTCGEGWFDRGEVRMVRVKGEESFTMSSSEKSDPVISHTMTDKGVVIRMREDSVGSKVNLMIMSGSTATKLSYKERVIEVKSPSIVLRRKVLDSARGIKVGQRVLFSEDSPTISDQSLCEHGYCHKCMTSDYIMCISYEFGVVRAMIIVTLVAVILIMVILAISAAKSIMWFFSVLKGFIMQPVRFVSSKFMRAAKKNAVLEVRNREPVYIGEVDMENDRETMIAFRQQDSRKRSVRLNSVMFLSFFLMFFVSYSTQCSTIVTGYFEGSTCMKFNSTHRECTIMPTITMSIPGTNTNACLDLQVFNSSVGQLAIGFESIVAETPLIRSYFTSDYDFRSQIANQCFLTTACDYSDNCETFSPIRTPNPGELFVVNDRPGRTQCITSEGGWACQCFLFGRKCQYSRYELVPKGEVFTVNTLSLTTFTSNIRVFGELTSGTKLNERFSSQSPFLVTELADFSFNGVFLDFNLNFGDEKVITAGSDAYFAKASSANQPKTGTIGDFQSSSSSFTRGSSDFDSTNFNFLNDCNNPRFDVREAPSASKIRRSDKLPSVRTGLVWNYDTNKKSIWSHINRQLSASVTVRFKKPLTIMVMEETVCPELNLKVVRGCHSCDSSAELLVSARSSCFEGTCAVTMTKSVVRTTNILLPSSFTDSVISFQSSTKEIDEELVITCRFKTIRVRVKSLLLDPVLIVDEDVDPVVENPDDVTDGSIDVPSFSLFNLGSVPSILILVVIVFISGALTVLAAYLAWKFILPLIFPVLLLRRFKKKD